MAPSQQRPEPEEIILYEKDPKTKIATITFNRPEFLNAPTSLARLRYADVLRAANADNDVKVVIIRGVGDNLGSGADLPEFMEGNDNPAVRLAELRLEDPDIAGEGGVSYPPKGTFRNGATISSWYANSQAGNRALQDFKKISIVEAKGYCYGWHFYQCADADLVISSDDALFGHPSFRYHGWGPRMWTWVQMMGLRKFQEMVFTGRPFTAAEMYDCNFLNKVVPGMSSRPRSPSTRWPAPGTARWTPSFSRRCSSRSSNSSRASTWAACCPRSSSPWATAWPTTATTIWTCSSRSTAACRPR